ncbi:thiamine pyrophosphokinase [Pseudobutyrivibrio sp. YE44]|uniref:thiamine diphosphokinase n=1 Tax=Pseudobutyrivibrio sp. YE44 TaxID=1520802 RepID=UPI00088A53C5|nr:thiamine diphosphokinase [Pseudobutyrivibrio sp. YE44]SDB20296.1 thiamine pyrophosphokinase [Pseudobutyrivibrio sp. YE44]
MITFIVGAMPLDEYTKNIMLKVPERERMIIACDKGYFHLKEAKLVPDLVIGDFDSAGEELYKELVSQGINVVKLNPVKDDTDVEAALKYAFDNSTGDIVILGAIGGRLDHTLGNIALLGMALKNGRKAYLWDRTNRVQMIEGGQSITLEKALDYKYVSVFPYGGLADGVNMEGFKYPVSDGTIEGFNTLTVSNELIEDTGEISIKKGYLIVMETKD